MRTADGNSTSSRADQSVPQAYTRSRYHGDGCGAKVPPLAVQTEGLLGLVSRNEPRRRQRFRASIAASSAPVARRVGMPSTGSAFDRRDGNLAYSADPCM